METIYDKNSKVIKALGDSSRLKIIDILSCGERCACDILEHFDFTQPTLSHHMKVLSDCGLVECRKVGTWNHYKINITNANRLILFLMNIVTETEDCICRDQEFLCNSEACSCNIQNSISVKNE